MNSRLTKEQSFEKWGIVLDQTFSLSKLKRGPREVVEMFIEQFPNLPDKKVGLCIISRSIDAFIVASFVSEKLYDKISKAIRVFQVVDYMINAARYGETASTLLQEVDEKILSADLVIFNEIAPAKYMESQKLLLYHLISSCISKRKCYIITANNPIEEITENLGSSLIRLITTYSFMIGV